MFRKVLGLALVLAISPAFADGLSYNYIELGYQNAEFDEDIGGLDVDGDGYGIRGSFEVGESWFIAASYSALDFDFGVDLDRLGIGAGFHMPISDRVDFFAALSFLTFEASASGFGSVDEDGYGVNAGLRGLVTDKLELNGHVAYSDLGDDMDGTAIGAGALYNLTDNFALGVEIEAEEDVTLYGIGARFYFGN
jgi:opacity protein-like surface antigen